MSREARTIIAGTPYHLISRFVDREWFITKPDERHFYLELLARALTKSDWRLLAFAVMSNHIHLAVVAGEQRLEQWLRRVHAPFADAMNRAYERIGPMFVRGPKAYAVELGRVGHLLAYIHNNPVRGGLCSRAVESDWTSHRAYVGAIEVPRWLHVREGIALSHLPAGATFDDWVADPTRASDELFTEEDYERETARRLEQQAAQRLASATQKSHAALAEAIAAAAASAAGISPAQLCGRSRGELEVRARSAAIHCAKQHGLSEQSIARALCLSQQRASVVGRREPSQSVRELTSRIEAAVAGATDATA